MSVADEVDVSIMGGGLAGLSLGLQLRRSMPALRVAVLERLVLLFPERAELWIPRSWEERKGESRGDQYLRVVALLKPGARLARAQAELDGLARRWQRQYPNNYPADSGFRPLAVPLA